MIWWIIIIFFIISLVLYLWQIHCPISLSLSIFNCLDNYFFLFTFTLFIMLFFFFNNHFALLYFFLQWFLILIRLILNFFFQILLRLPIKNSLLNLFKTIRVVCMIYSPIIITFTWWWRALFIYIYLFIHIIQHISASFRSRTN